MFIKITRITTHHEYHEFEMYINIFTIVAFSEYNSGAKIILSNNVDNTIIVKESIEQIINLINF